MELQQFVHAIQVICFSVMIQGVMLTRGWRAWRAWRAFIFRARMIDSCLELLDLDILCVAATSRMPYTPSPACHCRLYVSCFPFYRAHGVALVTGEGFGYSNGIRISYAASMEELDEALGEVRVMSETIRSALPYDFAFVPIIQFLWC